MKELQHLIELHYMKNKGITSYSIAIRDLLIDLFHLGDTKGFDLRSRLEHAEATYMEECDEIDKNLGIEEIEAVGRGKKNPYYE